MGHANPQAARRLPTAPAVTLRASPSARTGTRSPPHRRRDGGAAAVGHAKPQATRRPPSRRATALANSTTIAVAFSPDGNTLAFAGSEGAVRLLDAHNHRQLAVLRGHRLVFELAFSPDGQLLASAGRDGTSRLWDARTPRAARSPPGPRTSSLKSPSAPTATRSRLSATTRRCGCGTRDTHRQLATFARPTCPSLRRVQPRRPHARHRRRRRHRAAVGHPQAPAARRPHRPHRRGPARRLQPRRHTLASASDDTTVRLWDTRSRKQLAATPRTRGFGQRRCLQPRRPHARLCRRRRHGAALGRPQPRTLAVLKRPRRLRHGVAFSPDGARWPPAA